MVHVSFWHPAGTYPVPGKGEFPEKFAPHAFDRAIGKQVPVTGPDGESLGLGTLVAADVALDGSGVTLTVDMPFFAETAPPAAEGMSFAFREPGEDLSLRDPLAGKLPRIRWREPGKDFQ